MAKYRSIPRDTEAYQIIAPIDMEQTGAFPSWFIELIGEGIIVCDETTGDGTVINEAHGEMSFKDGDWIIFNGATDVYPCIDDEFQKRYEKVEE